MHICVFGQTDPVIEGSDIRPFTASGSIGFSANAYTATGIENRRAPASLKTTANLNFSLFGLSSGLNLLYSTDQSKFRQNMNNISFDASWEWITLQAGDVSPNYSRFGISGATIRGGYLKLNPDRWLLELSAGRSKRDINNTANDEFREPAFERWALAGKAGYKNNDNYFYLSSHYSLDKSRSLENLGNLTPQENLTITPDVGLTLFDNLFSFESQVTFSAYTRDLNSAKIPTSDLGIPGFLTNIMQPHVSSRINYAGQASAKVNLNNFGAELGYERIQPGFRSLGIGQIQDDQEKIRFAPSLRLLDNRLSVQSNFVLGRDNLLNTRIKTRKSTGIGTNIQFQLSEMILVNGNYNLLINDFSSSSSAPAQNVSPDQKQVSHTIMLQPSVTIQADQKTHNVSLSASYFNLNIDFDSISGTSAPRGMTSNTYSSSATYSLMFPSGFTVNTMGNFLISESRSANNTTLGGNLGASYSFLERKLTMSLNGGFNQNLSTSSVQNADDIRVKSQQFTLSLTGNYRLTPKDTFSLSVRSRGNNVVEGGSTTYSELEASLKYRHQF